MASRKKRRTIAALIIVLSLLILAFSYKPFQDMLSEPEILNNIIGRWGILAHIIVVLLIILQGVFSIIPLPLFIIFSGLLFGFWIGSLYSLIGSVLGASVTFWFARRYKKRLKRWISEDEAEYFRKIVKAKKENIALLGRIILPLPNNILSFAAGLTKVKFRKYFLMTLLGFIPFVLLFSYLGSKLVYGINAWPITISLFIILCITIILKYHPRVHKFLNESIFCFNSFFFKNYE